MQGAPEPKKLISMAVLKFGVVMIFLENPGGWTGQVIPIADEMMEMMLENLSFGTFACEWSTAEYLVANLFHGELYARMDCLINKLFGATGSVALQNAPFGLLTSALFSGSMGTIVFLGGAMALISVMQYMLRFLIIIVVAYVVAGILMVMTPLFAPLLVLGVGAQAFGAWWKNLVGCIIQPMMAAAYLAMTLPIIDHYIFEDNHSLYRVLANAPNVSSSGLTTLDMANAFVNPYQRCSIQIPQTNEFADQLDGGDANIRNAQEDLRNKTTPVLAGASDLCATLKAPALDFGAEQFETLVKLGHSTIILLLVSYLLSKGMALVPQLASKLAGAGFFFDDAVRKTGVMDNPFTGGASGMSKTIGKATSMLGGK